MASSVVDARPVRSGRCADSSLAAASCMASFRNTSLPSIVVCGRGSPWPNHLSAAVHPVPDLMLRTGRSSQSNSQPPHVVCVLASSCGALVLDVGFESLTIFVIPRCCCISQDYHGSRGMIIHSLALGARGVLSNTSFLLNVIV